MFRFKIRDLLWLMVVVGCLSAWWTDHHKSFAERAQISRNANELADELEYGRFNMRPLPSWIDKRRSSTMHNP